jgi:NADPH2 dehydrogenase
VRAQALGFDFVDVKHCHGYLGHELLSATERPGRYGGSFENRTRFLRTILDGIASAAPGLRIGVRLSAYDDGPFRAGAGGVGEPDRPSAASEGATSPTFGGPDLAETHALIELLVERGVHLVCVTAGSPYYNPHIQRPAYFPPSDGYLPPEDPLLGVARMVDAAVAIKARHPQAAVVASGFTYLQEWLPHVAQALVRRGAVDLVGLGRMVLSYPTLPADVLAGNGLDRRHLCRTFSDCTTAPRNGLVSGCYPLDEHYKARPERVELARIKKAARTPGESDGDGDGDGVGEADGDDGTPDGDG